MNPVIETPRLLLREFTREDIDDLHAIVSDPITMKFYPGPLTRQQAIDWIERSMASYAEHGFGRWGTIEKSSGTMIGHCGIINATVDGRDVIDIGYIITHPLHGLGYATEAAAAVRDHAFGALEIPAIHANMAQDHHASSRVAEKIGMTRIGEFLNARNRDLPTFLYELRR
ncbi:MAG: family acetyltransferase [Chlorobi bacterium]|nr:family acetyltransferase [Chlorobiota bacterium]